MRIRDSTFLFEKSVVMVVAADLRVARVESDCRTS